MNKKTFLFVFFIFLACDVSSEKILIHNVNVIDPLDGISKNTNVEISNNKISSVGKKTSFFYSKKIDGSGKYLIPGLWDSHVHLYFDQELAKDMPMLFLKFGITSIRDTGGDFNFLDSIKKLSEKYSKSYPRLKISGPLIDGKFNVYNGERLPNLSVKTENVKETENVVNKLIASGADFLKAYEMLSPEQFEIIMKIAKKKKINVTGHIPLSMDIETASNLGLNSLEHIKNLELWATKDKNELLKVRRGMMKNTRNLSGLNLRGMIHNTQKNYAINNLDKDETIKIYEALAKNNTWQIPTISIYKVPIYKIFKDDYWIENLKYLPEKTREIWEERINFSNKNINPKQKDFSDWVQRTTKEMHDYGIEFMAGTDSPLGFLIPGFSLHIELELLVESGMSELDAIKTATINPSRYFNMENYLGLIKEGYIADLILLNTNPLENIKNTLDISLVVKDGKVYEDPLKID
tara:strand:+ start:2907 stop:4301 length:1395 start_codon:yes stop_codon:yes gene_type:complete